MNPIRIIEQKYTLSDLEQFRGCPYDSMIKYVVDIEKGIIAIGGEMHSDAEQVLLSNGSNQEAIWGANLYPWNDPIEIEFTSLINIRPGIGNRSMEIQDDAIKELVKNITNKWINIS